VAIYASGFFPEARADLHQIWDYVAEDDVEAATRLVDLVEEKCALLARSPGVS
jgi:plasmid stabilization system protein ParE